MRIDLQWNLNGLPVIFGAKHFQLSQIGWNYRSPTRNKLFGVTVACNYSIYTANSVLERDYLLEYDPKCLMTT